MLLLLAPDADPAADRDGEIVVGPTGKVRKFLMRERLLAGTGASAAEGSS